MLEALGQTRRMAMVESVANVLLGYTVAIIVQLLAFPAFGVRLSFGDNLRVGLVFTIASLIRSYALRRMFERIRMR